VLTRIHLLAVGGFAVGTSAYVVAGVLPAVSAELDVSLTAAGQLTTAFALAYAIGAPLLAVLTCRWERRTLLVTALLVAGLGNALSAVAPNYELLLGARVLGALGAAAFTPAATAVATLLSPPHRRGRAVALVFGGLTLALVLGVPAGSLLGGPLGFRGVFALVAAVCVVSAVSVRMLLPRVEPAPPVGLRARLAVAADGAVLGVLAISVLGLVAVMSVYTYVAPLLAASAGVTGPTLGVLLLVYGAGSLAGNTLGGRLADRFGSRPPLLAVYPVFTAVLATMPLTAGTRSGAAAALFLLGLCTWTTNAPLQSRLIEVAPSNSGLVLSLNASAIYLGAGLSGVVGGMVIEWMGVLALPPVAAVLSLSALGLMLVVLRPVPTPAAPELPAPLR
jgi:predicted MFS family arabinose efflux permease